MTPDSGAPSPPNADASGAHVFVRELVRAIKTGALYEPGHPQRGELTTRAWSALTALIFGRELIRLEISYEGLTVDDQLVNIEDGAELVQRFSAGGLVSLTLRQNLMREELDGLIELLAIDFSHVRLDDDMATLLWARNWPNVSWEAAEVPLAPVSEDASTFNSSISEDTLPDPLRADTVPPHEFLLGEKERDRLATEVDHAHHGMTPPQMGEVLIQLIQLETRSLELGITLQHFRTVVDYAIEKGRFREARETTNLLNRFREDSGSLTEEKRRAIADCWSGFSDPGTIECIVTALDTGAWDEADEVVQFLGQRSSSITGPLIDAFLKMENVEGREIVRLSLVQLLRKDIEPLRSRVSKFQGERVLFLVRLLRDVGHKEVVTILKSIMESPNAEVRKEILSALGRIGGAHSRAIMVRSLSDSSLGVRCRAAMMLPVIGPKEALDPLLKEMLRPEFRERDLDERLHFFRALGETNVAEVLPLIRKLIYQKGWWKRRRVEDDRLCATTALVAMTHPEAVTLRRELRGSGPKSVRAHLDILQDKREAA
jgi:hypothetical protein